MSRHRHYYYDPKMIRDTLNAAVEKANEVQAKEYELIQSQRIVTEVRRPQTIVNFQQKTLFPQIYETPKTYEDPGRHGPQKKDWRFKVNQTK